MPTSASPPVEPVDACPVCESRDRARVLPDAGGIGVARCRGCGLVHATGLYVADYLREDYYAARSPRREPQTPVPQPSARPGVARKRRAVHLYDRLSGGRIGRPRAGAHALDIGCDTGLLLDALRELGYRTEGIERSPAGEQARAAGHEVHTLDIEVHELGLGRYDLITVTHVLEHLRRPVRGLVWIRRHLAPGGLAAIEVPNWGDLLRPLWGRRFRPLELGDHVSFFERTTLAAALQRAGLETVSLWSAPQVGTAIAPSLLTALDLGLELRRRARAAISGEVQDPSAAVAGVAGVRLAGGAQAGTLRRTVGPALVAALDGLDARLGPWLERAFGAECSWGANLVAVVRAHG